MTAVTLQIYDLVDQTPFCCGFFHTGVLVRGVEWSFGGGGGIVGTPPRASVPDGCRFREALLLGYIENNADIARCLDRVRPDFQADTYNVVFKNCNDFSHRFCQELFRDQGGRGIPAYINRLAWWGRQWPVKLFVPGYDPNLHGGGTSGTRPATPERPLINTAGPGVLLGGSIAGGGSSSSTSSRTSASAAGGGGSAAGDRSSPSTVAATVRTTFSRIGSAALAPVSMLLGRRGRATEDETQPALGAGGSSVGSTARELQLRAAQERNQETNRLAENAV